MIYGEVFQAEMFSKFADLDGLEVYYKDTQGNQKAQRFFLPLVQTLWAYVVKILTFETVPH